MCKTLLLVLVLVGSTLGLQAQEGDPGADIWQPISSPPTVEGCLQNSATHYYVIQNDGTATRLTGDTAKLRRFVGHEVEITGKPTLITLDTTVIHAASTVEELPALAVNNAKELAKTCSSPASQN